MTLTGASSLSRNKFLTVERLEHGEELDGVPDRWVEVGKIWASIKPMSSREYLQADQMRGEWTHEIVSRYFSGATTAMRLRHGQRVFDVSSVINQDERNRWSVWRCREQERG